MAIHHRQARMAVPGVEFQNGLSLCGGKWDSDESVKERRLYTVKANEGKKTKEGPEILTALLPHDSTVTHVFMFILFWISVYGQKMAEDPFKT